MHASLYLVLLFYQNYIAQKSNKNKTYNLIRNYILLHFQQGVFFLRLKCSHGSSSSKHVLDHVICYVSSHLVADTLYVFCPETRIAELFGDLSSILFVNMICPFISVINQLDAQNFCFTISSISWLYMFRAHVLIIRRSKMHYTASGIVTLKQVSGLKLLKYNSINMTKY